MKISLVVASGVHQGKPDRHPRDPVPHRPGRGLPPPPGQPRHQQEALPAARPGRQGVRPRHGEHQRDVRQRRADHRRARTGRRRPAAVRAAGLLRQSSSPASRADSTPLPDALKAVGKSGQQKPAPPSRSPPAPTAEDDPDKIAAMLLGMGDDDSAEVPGGSTIMDMPSVEDGSDAGGQGRRGQEEEGRPVRRRDVRRRQRYPPQVHATAQIASPESSGRRVIKSSGPDPKT